MSDLWLSSFGVFLRQELSIGLTLGDLLWCTILLLTGPGERSNYYGEYLPNVCGRDACDLHRRHYHLQQERLDSPLPLRKVC
jgi:hypothetical protein